VRTNLYERHGLSLLVPEEVTELPGIDATPAGDFIDKLIRESKIVARCSSCGTLSVIGNDGHVQFFAPVDA